jgi:adenylate kinase
LNRFETQIVLLKSNPTTTLSFFFLFLPQLPQNVDSEYPQYPLDCDFEKKGVWSESIVASSPLARAHMGIPRCARALRRVVAETTVRSPTVTTTTVPWTIRAFPRTLPVRSTGRRLLGTHSRNQAECLQDREIAADLFHQYAKDRNGVPLLGWQDICELLQGIGEDPDDATVQKLFTVADADGNDYIDLDEFLAHRDTFIGTNPARIILVVGGPGSGKGLLSKRLEKECHVVHLSSGELLRSEVAQDTALGRQVRDIMDRGELVSSAIMVALMKKRMRDHPGKRVLLDGFPRSLENAHDLVTLCGRPELALHLECDDTILLERILQRGADSAPEERRADDNFQTALQRLRTYHAFHNSTIHWLREQHVPVVNLDCSGTAESVWQQLQAIGRLMRPSVKVPSQATANDDDDDWSGDPSRTALF